MKAKSYAKINLTLNILNKRNDGYHNLKSVMIPINLYDELEFELNDTYILNSNFDIDINDNIITKVFNIFKNRYNIGNVKINLNKNIPHQAGLAGGSSNATTTIKCLNELFNLNLDIKTLEEIALEVGSDTLFTLHSTPAIVSSRGDILNVLENCNPDFYVLLIKPNFGFSTKDIFNNSDIFNQEHNDEIIDSLINNDVKSIDSYCYNSFLNTILNTNKEFNDLYSEISKYKKPHLTGSGSTLFLLSNDIKELNDIKDKFNNCYTNIVSTKLS
ncbi:MAG: 4-(cytidine 5'-diphospho)-2-C-methyl-D-erythritol kinase [bacterium]